MAEPAGILFRARISEEKLASFFKRRIAHGAGEARVGHVLSELLDQGDARGDVLIVNHDAESDSLFLAWILNHYAPDAIAPMWPVLNALADHMGATAGAEGALTSTLPECREALQIEAGCLIRGPAQLAPQQAVANLADQLWSFAVKGEFPDAVRSMRRRNCQCKPFKTAWKNYLKWRDEQERPARIAAATETNPYCLINNIVCWADKVVDRDDYTRRDIPFPRADPLSFRSEAGYYADKNHVWQRRLAKNSPPLRLETGESNINNPAAIWENLIVPDAVGADFTWFDRRWDTMFWTDKRRIYALDNDLGLIPLPDVHSSEFRIFGQCFGTDGKSVFCHAIRLPLNPEKLQTESYFIWDDEKVFMLTDEVPIGARNFRILGQKHVVGPGGGIHFRLADAEKRVVLGPDNACLPDDPLF